jgi:hypothetical protein
LIIGEGRFAHCQIGSFRTTLRTSEVHMSMSPATTATASGPGGAHGSTALEWLNAILFPDGDSRFEPGQPDDHGAWWWANPSAAAAQTLMPATPAAAARRSVRRYHDGHGVRRRLRSAAAELAMRTGPLVHRLPLGEPVRLIGSLDDGVIGGLRRALDIADLTVAVSLAQEKSNRKPVLQLLAGGNCVGFAKVATTEHARALVDNEAAWLTRRPSVPLAMPQLRWSGELAGASVLVMTAVIPPRLPRRRPLDPPPAALFAAVAALGQRRTTPLADSAWWARVQQLRPLATPAEIDALDTVADRDASQPLGLAAWHGDLTPWNLFTARGTHHLIDWEFAADDVPCGFDLCHFHLQAGNEMLALEAPAALARARRLVAAKLGPNEDTIWRAYLVELLRRQLHLRSIGYPEHTITHGPAAVAALGRVRSTT